MPDLLLNSGDWKALRSWYEQNGAAYPWAGISNPWAIWVSEVMLQQTTVSVVEKRFVQWMRKYPSPESLAAAPEEEVLREWEGLGYYSRARNLAASARELTLNYGGRVPRSSEVLQTFPGVGPYVASAVASFAFGERTAAIDANGRRIAQRLAARQEWNSSLEKEFRQAVEKGMSGENPGILNAALMQLGQQVCTPRKPQCPRCPLKKRCAAQKAGLQDQIPPRRRGNIIQKQTVLALLVHKRQVLMVKRKEGIGRGLWFFPDLKAVEALAGKDWENKWTQTGILDTFIHTYTRYRELLQPAVFELPENQEKPVWRNAADIHWSGINELGGRPMASVYRQITQALVIFLENRYTVMPG